jgi:hypothetical protein
MFRKYTLFLFVASLCLVILSCKDNSVTPPISLLDRIHPATKATMHGLWGNIANRTAADYYEYDSVRARIDYKMADSLNYRYEWWADNFDPANRSLGYWFDLSTNNDTLYLSYDSLFSRYSRYVRIAHTNEFDHWIESFAVTDSIPAPGVLGSAPQSQISALTYFNSSWYAVLIEGDNSIVKHFDIGGQLLDSLAISVVFD